MILLQQQSKGQTNVNNYEMMASTRQLLDAAKSRYSEQPSTAEGEIKRDVSLAFMGTPVKPSLVQVDSRAAIAAHDQSPSGIGRQQLSGVIDLDQSDASNRLRLARPDQSSVSPYPNYYLPSGHHKKLQSRSRSRSRKLSPMNHNKSRTSNHV